MKLDPKDISTIATEIVRQLCQIARQYLEPEQNRQVKPTQMKVGGPPERPPNSLLTGKEAAAILSVSWSTMEGWRVHGKGPEYIKLGRSVRYKVSDLQEYIKTLDSV